jgi:hypothetical protein
MRGQRGGTASPNKFRSDRCPTKQPRRIFRRIDAHREMDDMSEFAPMCLFRFIEKTRELHDCDIL